MMRHTFFQLLFRVLALNRLRDFVLKPLLVSAVIVALSVAVALVVRGLLLPRLPATLLIAWLVQLPILALAFGMVSYMTRLQQELALLAMTDELTGLPNRRAFVTRAANAHRGGATGFVLIIDADHFKRINDSYGHAVGDQCLQAIAGRLNAVRRPQDLIGRIGGEEFGAFLPAGSVEEIHQIGQRLCAAILIDLPQQGHPLRLTLSAGAAATQADALFETSLSRADTALYRAKAQGRARLLVWSGEPAADVA